MEQPAPGSPVPPTLSSWQRIPAVFARPREALAGLVQRPTSLLPLAIFLATVLAQTLLIYQPYIVPMQLEQMEARADAGDIPAEHLDRAEAMMRSPVAVAFGALTGMVVITVFNLLIAGLALLGVNFILGGGMTFRQAWSLTWWSSLISAVGVVVSTAVTLATGRFPAHLGLGILAPAEDATSKLGFFLGTLLDGINPFALWWLAVAVIGASAISGKPARAIAWVYGGFYLVGLLIAAGVGGLAHRVSG